MCGIVGYQSVKTANADALRAVVQGMAGAIIHRGPDAEGVWCDEPSGLALGHRRLSILELSPHGAQPMASRDGRFVLSFNGELYNHLDVRHELQTRGFTEWRGRSDTETLVEAVAAFGFEGALQRITGMFAFAVWDREERVLRLAVDRLGEKPLYYGDRTGEFFFASEPCAFAALPDWNPRVDRNVLGLYLRFGFVPGPHAIHQGISKLEPGCALEVRFAGAEVVIHKTRYWDLHQQARRAATHRFAGSPEDAVAELDRRLRHVISRQMVSDVPLGAFLSGGVDSSTIVAIMQAQSARPVRTFTIGFSSREHDETEDARKVAEYLGTDHTTLRLEPRDALALIPRLPQIYSEPFADASQIPTILVSQLARRHVTVSLSGDAGDELFGGYNRHVWANGMGRKLAAWPPFARRSLAAGLGFLPPAAWSAAFQMLNPVLPGSLKVRTVGEKIGKLTKSLSAANTLDLYRKLVSHWEHPGTLVRGLQEPSSWIDAAAAWDASLDPAETMMQLDMLHYLPYDILTKVDRASMSVSLESRVPFLDHELVEFALSLPVSYKICDNTGKWVLRQVLERYIPRASIERPKMGFSLPLAAWLRGPLRDWAEALLDPTRLRHEGYLQPDPIRKAWKRHLSGVRNEQNALWTVLMFQAWLEQQGSAPSENV